MKEFVMPKSKLKPSEQCESCNGKGFCYGDSRSTCQLCEGSGKKQKMVMAFWRSDTFPYVLGSHGVMRDNGWVYCPLYSSSFLPLKVMDMEEGERLKAELLTLVRHKRDLEYSIHELLTNSLDKLIPWRNDVSRR